MRNSNIVIVLVVVCALLGASGGRAAALQGAAAASSCTGPVTHDPYDGYHLGVPAGWAVFHIDGRLVVTPSGTSPEQSLVAPVLLTKGLTPARYFTSAMQLLDKQIDSIGNAMSYRVTASPGGVPQATLTGRAGTIPVTGRATVLVLPDHTAYGSQVAVLSAYWAPTAQFNAEQGKLAAVALCYGPEQAPLFRVFQDQAFTYAMPPSFRVKSEGQDNLLIAEGNDASASFLLTLLTPSSGVTSVQTLQQYIFEHEGIRATNILATSTSPKVTSNGAVNQLEDFEFTGFDGTTPVHGLASVFITIGVDISGTMRLAMTKTAEWNSTSGAVLRIAGGIQHSFAQDLQQWENISRQEQQFGQQVAGFDQALNGEDLVRDTATGQTYEAPYNSYLQSGPNGPGYYTGSAGALQKLQVITPS
jgi:hypothetical protein